MKLRLVHEYEEGISLETIKGCGTYLIRKQGRLERKLENYIRGLNSNISV